MMKGSKKKERRYQLERVIGLKTGGNDEEGMRKLQKLGSR